jgi:hypothetical protein
VVEVDGHIGAIVGVFEVGDGDGVEGTGDVTVFGGLVEVHAHVGRGDGVTHDEGIGNSLGSVSGTIDYVVVEDELTTEGIVLGTSGGNLVSERSRSEGAVASDLFGVLAGEGLYEYGVNYLDRARDVTIVVIVSGGYGEFADVGAGGAVASDAIAALISEIAVGSVGRVTLGTVGEVQRDDGCLDISREGADGEESEYELEHGGRTSRE